MGGTEPLLRVDGLEAVQQLVDDPRAAQWQPGQRLALAGRGRSSGRFVTVGVQGGLPGPTPPHRIFDNGAMKIVILDRDGTINALGRGVHRLAR